MPKTAMDRRADDELAHSAVCVAGRRHRILLGLVILTLGLSLSTRAMAQTSDEPTFLQVGAFLDNSRALSLAETLQRLTFPVQVVVGPDFDRVLVGPLCSPAALHSATLELQVRGYQPFRRSDIFTRSILPGCASEDDVNAVTGPAAIRNITARRLVPTITLPSAAGIAPNVVPENTAPAVTPVTEPAAPHPATTLSEQTNGADALRVFLDCDDDDCDLDHLRTEITFVNYVRDRRDAQVHVLVTTEQTGGNGRAYTIDFIGLEEFSDVDNQLVHFSTSDNTDDDERRELARILRLGLVQYAIQTPLARVLDVTQPDDANTQLNARETNDPWNFWVFRTRFSVRKNAEERETSESYFGSFSANRTTDQWRVNLGVYLDYDKDTFDLDSGTFTDISRDHAATGLVIKSLGEHFGAGFGGSAVTSTFRNLDHALRLAPAIEYNFFPYSASTRRQFTLRYAAGLDAFKYEEPTIFDKSSELRASQSFVSAFDVNQPWGSADFAVELAQFLDNTSQYRVVVYGDIEIRLFRGFFLSVSGDSSLVRDQIYLSRAGVTDAEILVRRRQLATDYEYGFRIGITYSFGSIYNNVVNTRFAGSSGGFIRAF